MITLLCCGHSRLQGLCDGADLVDFEQQTVAGLLLHSCLDPLGIGHSQVVSYDLIGWQTKMCHFNVFYNLLFSENIPGTFFFRLEEPGSV